MNIGDGQELLTFSGDERDQGTIVIEAQRMQSGSIEKQKIFVPWEQEDFGAEAVIYSIGLLTSKFGDIHHAYEYFQLSPIPGCNGLTAREVIKKRGASFLMEALDKADSVKLN